MIGLYIRPTKENGLRNMVNHNSSYVIVEKSIKLNRNFCFFLTGNDPEKIEDYISLRWVTCSTWCSTWCSKSL